MLYVVGAPDPAPGTDFELVVPGNFLYDVTGITATLQTGFPPTVAVDSSGNGYDGTYDGNQIFVPGLVAGDTAAQLGPAVFPNGFSHVTIPPAMPNLTTAFSFEWWAANVTPGRGWAGALTYMAANPANGVLDIYSEQLNPTDGDLFIHAWTIDWQSDPIVNLYDGNAHHFVITSDGVTKFTMYCDGVEIPSAESSGPGNPFTNFPAAVARIGSNSGLLNACSGILDEFAIYSSELSAIEVGNHYAAALSSFADYTVAVLASIPDAYYHLDGGLSTGRQPSLVVSDGTTELEAIPTGFPAVTTPGPYEYSWQPQLNADTQSTDGTLTTVAIPRLLLPAGYTVGTRTLDIAPTDQWSNVTLWWDDRYQQAANGSTAYAYPPGATYRRQPIG